MAFALWMKPRAPATTPVSTITCLGSRSGPLSLLSSRWPGSSRARALAQIARDTAACTAIMLAVKPMVSITSSARPVPEPS